MSYNSMIKTIIIILIVLIGLIMVYKMTNSEKIDVSPSEFQELLRENKGVVIDVRTKNEYDQGHLSITDAQYDFLSGEFKEQMESFDKDETYYLYCRSGNRSGQAARMMLKEGFENVYNVGGFENLANNGFESNQ